MQLLFKNETKQGMPDGLILWQEEMETLINDKEKTYF